MANPDGLMVTVRVAGVVFKRGETESHCAPPDVVAADPTAPKLIGAPLLVTLRLCCVALLEPSVTILNDMDAMDPINCGPPLLPCACKVTPPAIARMQITRPASVEQRFEDIPSINTPADKLKLYGTFVTNVRAVTSVDKSYPKPGKQAIR